jgi:phosphoacetylglucosamine mutase
MSAPKPTTEALMKLVASVPLSNGLPFYNYGTAGFRFKAEFMDGVMVRVGMLSMMILLLDQKNSDVSNKQLSTGVMVTASHNDESYNGVKLANPDGSMLTPPQEYFVMKWVNERDSSAFQTFLEKKAQEIVEKFKTRFEIMMRTVFVLNIGRDTRSHSEPLSDILIEGAKAFMGYVNSANADPVKFAIRDHGILTTPMLHHIVLHSNRQLLPSYIEPKNSRKGYIETYAKAYVDLLKGLPTTQKGLPTTRPGSLRIDAACGVGFRAVEELSEEITKLAGAESASIAPTLLSVHNGEFDGPLNVLCGSEHLQTELEPPTWYTSKSTMKKAIKVNSEKFPYCCSLDGDADRIVFFGQNTRTDLAQLLDGDKIAILIAHVFKEKFEEANAAATRVGASLPTIKIGIVQTAYANGASTDYVKKSLQIPVLLTKTGVKHLHHAAVENFDVGIYFEANGHGTVVFSNAYENFAQQCLEEHGNPFFVQLHRLINPAVGDALCDMLLVDYLLRYLGGWTLEDWNTKLYDDLPSRMLKVSVTDRKIIRCNSDESVCLEPTSVQPLLQTAMKTVKNGRCFVRPSGTEDVVRVYAEAKTRKEADALANEAAKIVFFLSYTAF